MAGQKALFPVTSLFLLQNPLHILGRKRIPLILSGIGASNFLLLQFVQSKYSAKCILQCDIENHLPFHIKTIPTPQGTAWGQFMTMRRKSNQHSASEEARDFRTGMTKI